MAEINTPVSLKMDLTHFKNETLKEIKQLEKTLSDNFRKSDTNIQNKLQEFEKKILEYNTKISQMETIFIETNDMKQKMEQLTYFKEKTENSMITTEYRIRSLEKEQQDTLYNMNNVLQESVLYPGVIGATGKFKNFHSLIDYILNQLSKDDKFREEMSVDFSSFKSKYDIFTMQTRDNFSGIYEKVGNYIKEDIESGIKNYDNKMQTILKEFEEKFDNMNNEFDKYFIQNNNIMTDIKKQIKKCLDSQNELFEKFEDISKISSLNNSEIILLKEKYQLIISGIKEAGIKNERGQKIKFNFGEENNKQNKISSPKKTRYFFNGEQSRKQTKIKSERSIENKMNKYAKSTFSKKSSSTLNKPFTFSNQLVNKKNNDLPKNKSNFEQKTLPTENCIINVTEMKLSKNNSTDNDNNSNRSLSNNYYTQPYMNNFEIGENTNDKTKNENDLEKNKIENINTVSNFYLDNKDNVDKIIFKIKGKNFQNNTPNNLQNSAINKRNNLNSSDKKSKCMLSQPLDKILINIEGKDFLELNPRRARSNSKMKNLFNSVNNIIKDSDFNKKNTILFKNTLGYPKIISNNGQQILVSSKPIFHSNKFCRYKNPKLNALDKNIKDLYENFKVNEGVYYKKNSFELKKAEGVSYIDASEKKSVAVGFYDENYFNDEKIKGYKNKILVYNRNNDKN